MSNDLPIVVVDAGHGGRDSGAVGPNGLREKDVALKVARLLGGLLAGACDVRYTRADDRFLELHERAAIANKAGADLFISIHCNSAANPASGFEVFTTPGDTKSDAAATDLFWSYAATFPGKTKRQDTKDGDPDKEASFAVLRLTNCAAVLFELEFIHTTEGEIFLARETNHGLMAQALAAGVLKYLKLIAAAPNPAAAPVPVAVVPALVPDGEVIYDLVAATLGQALQAYDAAIVQIHALSDEELRALAGEIRELEEIDHVAEEMIRLSVTEMAARWIRQGQPVEAQQEEGTEG